MFCNDIETGLSLKQLAFVIFMVSDLCLLINIASLHQASDLARNEAALDSPLLAPSNTVTLMFHVRGIVWGRASSAKCRAYKCVSLFAATIGTNALVYDVRVSSLRALYNCASASEEAVFRVLSASSVVDKNFLKLPRSRRDRSRSFLNSIFPGCSKSSYFLRAFPHIRDGLARSMLFRARKRV